jgi:hypothetical protein
MSSILSSMQIVKLKYFFREGEAGRFQSFLFATFSQGEIKIRAPFTAWNAWFMEMRADK